jgi:NAD(P)H-hydrate epimerase
MTPVRVTPQLAAGWVAARRVDSHKGTNGRVLVVAGSKGMIGAAVLSATAAVRSGAGLVRLATVASQQRAAVIRSPLEITTHALPEARDGRLGSGALRDLQRLIRQFKPTVVAAGPGMGINRGVIAVIRWLLWTSRTPLVLDADGLNALSDLGIKKKFTAPVVLTPHVGELARLLRVPPTAVAQNRLRFARTAAASFGCICVIKGPGTLTVSRTQAYENTTGNPAMGTGGMGDVLTGLIAASWAQQPDAEAAAIKAAAFGVFLHGLCADRAVRSFPERTLLASDLIAFLPEAYKKIWRRL